MDRNILIVDDEPNVAFFLSKSLERSNLGYRTTVAHSGEEAIRLLQDDERVFDLLVADLRLPGISGLELIRQTRIISPETRTVLITAYGSDRVKDQARRMGAGCYITKPFDIERFLMAVQEALSPSEEERILADEQRLRDLAVSWIFHKLRVPLTFVASYADLLAEQVDEEQVLQVADKIRHHVGEMRDAVDDFTLLSEWTVGQVPGYRQEMNVNHVLETVVAQLSALALEREQLVVVERYPEPVTLVGDRLALGLLLTSLLVFGMKSLPLRSQIVSGVVPKGPGILVTVYCAFCEEGGKVRPYDHSLSASVVRSLAEGLGGRLDVGQVCSADEWRCDLWLPGEF